VVLVEAGGPNPRTTVAEISLSMEVKEQPMQILIDKKMSEEGRSVEMGLILVNPEATLGDFLNIGAVLLTWDAGETGCLGQ